MTQNNNGIALSELVHYCHQFLNVSGFKDYCPNGLQVEGKNFVKKIVTGVTASQALIDKAIELQADAILVHHGYFWKGESEPLIGIKGKRIKALMQYDISLLAYHLPLDAHPQVGNNKILANKLGLSQLEALVPDSKPTIGNIGYTNHPTKLDDFIEHLESLGFSPQVIQGSNQPVFKVGLCTGSAQGYIEQAYLQGCDTFISGEISERTVHEAREMGIHYFALGHHRTETGGARALGEHLAQQFNIAVQFIDLDHNV